MPRKPRLDISGCLYHVIARGIERRNVFTCAEDYKDFTVRFQTSLKKTGSICLSWCLLPNHFHLLIKRGAGALSRLMRCLMTGYAVNFNIRHKRAGHLFQNRYKAILCEEDVYMRELAAYIHLNPLRAKLVANYEGLSGYAWSGHRELLRGRKGIIDRESIMDYFGGLKAYEDYLRERIGRSKKGEYSGGGLIRSMGGLKNLINGGKELFDERILGSGEFVGRFAGDEEAGPERMSRQEILAAVFKRTGIKEPDILSVSRRRDIVCARALYCHLSREKGGRSGVELAKELKISGGAVSLLAGKGRGG